MSSIKVRAALESAINAMTPAVATSFENVAFNPPASTIPFQQVNILFAQPDNSEYGSAHREQGIMQVRLEYPLQAGTLAVMTRAELLRSTFYRGASFVNGGVTVIIEKTPEISTGSLDGNMWCIPVKIRFFANIQ